MSSSLPVLSQLALLLLAACSPDPPAPDHRTAADTDDTAGDGSQDTAGDDDTGEEGPPDDTGEEELDLAGVAVDIPLPDFAALNLDGSPRGPEDLADGPTVLWFYFEAGDDACTTDACAYKALQGAFAELGVGVVGVSFEEPGDNAAWAEAEGLEYDLWTDSNRTLAEAYGALPSPDATAPDLVTVLLSGEGSAILRYRPGMSLDEGPQAVLDDCAILWGE